MAVKTFGKAAVFTSADFHTAFRNSRVLYRAVLWSASAEDELNRWYSTNYNVEVHAYVKNGKYCVVNNTYESQDTVVYKGDGSSFPLHMEANEIRWYPKIKTLFSYLMIIVGAILASFFVACILLPNDAINYGTAGIAIIISKLTGYNSALCVLLVFLPFLIVGVILIGKYFFVKTFVGFVVYTIGLSYLKKSLLS